MGFEPTQGDPIGLAGRRLNHSAKVSVSNRLNIIKKGCLFGITYKEFRIGGQVVGRRVSPTLAGAIGFAESFADAEFSELLDTTTATT